MFDRNLSKVKKVFRKCVLTIIFIINSNQMDKKYNKIFTIMQNKKQKALFTKNYER